MTTPSTLESISSDLLLGVAGGCHKGRGCRCSAPEVTTINAPVTQYLQAPQLPVPQDPGPVVSTNVSINGQPQVGP